MLDNSIKIGMQDIMDIQSGGVIYSEVLIRRYRNFSDVSVIMQYIYDKDIQAQFDLDVIKYTLEELSKDDYYTGKKVAFNLCGSTIIKKDMADNILRIMEESNTNNIDVAIEITEYTKFEYKTVKDNINKLRENGVQIILDDFGKRRANIECLLNNDFDIIKLDSIFIQKACKDKKAMSILNSVISLCTDIKVPVVVEGIETIEHLEIAKALGASYGQGYLLGKPQMYCKGMKNIEIMTT